MIDEKIKNKIKKLLSLSESDNQAEAELAAKKASDLLLKYNLSISDIKRIDLKVAEEDFINGKRIRHWRWDLLMAVARLNFCSTLKHYRKKKNEIYNSISIIGKKHNIIITKEIYNYLEKAIYRITEKYRNEIPKNGTESFRKGMSYTIANRLEEKRQARLRGEDNGLSESKDLIIAEYYNSEKEINDYNKEHNPRIKTDTHNYEVDYSFEAGLAAGYEVGLDDQIISNARKSLKSVI